MTKIYEMDFVMAAYLLIIATFFADANAFSKHWKWTSSWEDPANWSPPRLPCPNDNIVLKDGVIFVNRNMTVETLNLPDSGELVLEENVEMSFESEKQPGQGSAAEICQDKGESVEFVGNKARNWLNPLNWEILESGLPSKYTDASLFVDRIPCTTDTVSFPETDAYYIQLDKRVVIGNVILNGKIQRKEQFDQFLNSPAGKKRINLIGSGEIFLQEKSCNKLPGCPCGNKELKDSICQSFQCPTTCEQRVRPVGDCCDHCGTLISASVSAKFRWKKCQTTLRNMINNPLFRNVRLVISPINDTHIQILLTDDLNGMQSLNAARVVEDHLKNSSDETCSSPNVLVITDTGKSQKKEDTNNKATVTMTVILTVVVVLIIALVVFVVYKRRCGSVDIKRRELRNEPSFHSAVDSEFADTAFRGGISTTHGPTSLENPSYGYLSAADLLPDSPKFEIPVSPGNSAVTADKERKDVMGFDNPLYSEEEFPAYDSIVENPYIGGKELEKGQQNPLYLLTDLEEQRSSRQGMAPESSIGMALDMIPEIYPERIPEASPETSPSVVQERSPQVSQDTFGKMASETVEKFPPEMIDELAPKEFPGMVQKEIKSAESSLEATSEILPEAPEDVSTDKVSDSVTEKENGKKCGEEEDVAETQTVYCESSMHSVLPEQEKPDQSQSEA